MHALGVLFSSAMLQTLCTNINPCQPCPVLCYAGLPRCRPDTTCWLVWGPSGPQSRCAHKALSPCHGPPSFTNVLRLPGCASYLKRKAKKSLTAAMAARHLTCTLSK